MDYEKKYKEMKARVLEIGRGYVNGVDFSKPRQIAEYIDPDLKDSDDEKIRKGLIEHLKELKEQSVEGSHLKRPEHYDAWIAWLEKQDEKKLLNNEEYQTVPVETLDRLYAAEKELERLKQGEQESINQCNTHEPTLDEAKKWNEAYEKGYSLGYENGRNEQKPIEWSEEDERHCCNIIWHLRNSMNNGDGDRGCSAGVYEDWLKSLKDRVQPKRDWSEEDIVAIDCAAEVLSKDLPSLAASIKRLKFLRPQHQWKPTKAMLDPLNWAKSEFHPDCKDTMDNLTYLYNEIEQLYDGN